MDDPIGYGGFGNPDKSNQQGPRQLFIHELVPAWQISIETFVHGLISEAIKAQVTMLGEM